MNIADLADQQSQPILDAAIREIRGAIPRDANGVIITPINETGHCLHCGEPVPDLRRWCDAECRDGDGDDS